MTDPIQDDHSEPDQDSGGGQPGTRWPWRAAFFTLAGLGAAGAMAWALFGPWLLVVRSEVVIGARTVPASQVLSVAAVTPGTPLIRVNPGQIAARVAAIRQVAGAHVTRSWPDRVVITITERTCSLAVPAPGGGFDLVDGYGVVVRWTARHPAGLPLYLTSAGPLALRGSPEVSAAVTVLGELPGWLRGSVQSVTAPAADQVTVRAKPRTTILWGGIDGAAAKMAELAILMRTHARYFDVSAAGTAMIK